MPDPIAALRAIAAWPAMAFLAPAVEAVQRRLDETQRRLTAAEDKAERLEMALSRAAARMEQLARPAATAVAGAREAREALEK